MTLTHNCYNHYADPGLPQDRTWIVKQHPYTGVIQDPLERPLGKECGYVYDLSHVCTDTMLDVIGGNPASLLGSESPVIFSHPSAYTLCPHPRYLPDETF